MNPKLLALFLLTIATGRMAPSRASSSVRRKIRNSGPPPGSPCSTAWLPPQKQQRMATCTPASPPRAWAWVILPSGESSCWRPAHLRIRLIKERRDRAKHQFIPAWSMLIIPARVCSVMMATEQRRRSSTACLFNPGSGLSISCRQFPRHYPKESFVAPVLADRSRLMNSIGI